jgi:hypothetical protein
MADPVSDKTERVAPTYSMDQAAERLRISRRTLQDWLRMHPADQHGDPLHSKIGSRKIFNDEDIGRIRTAALEEERLRLNVSRPTRIIARAHRHAEP